jgi:hypothetical protein
MKKLIIAATALVLVACTGRAVSVPEIVAASKACKSISSDLATVSSYRRYDEVYIQATCKSGVELKASYIQPYFKEVVEEN